MKLAMEKLLQLEHQHGESFYALDLDSFEANYHEFLAAFRALYPASNIAYSYKTNYIPRLCQLVKQWGGYAEVVSRMEYDLAERVGVPADRIIFNGPYKSTDDLRHALVAGAYVNLDQPCQVEVVERLAQEVAVPTTLKVGLRCNFAEGSERRSRFGFDADGAELKNVLTRLKKLSNVQLAGLHCHFLPPGRNTDSYARIARRMLALSASCLDSPPRFLDLGGGFYSKMGAELRRQFDTEIPSYRDYAQAIAVPFAEAFPDGGPELLLEPGMALIADTCCFVTRVLDIHEVASRRLALVAGSIYDIKPTLHRRNLPIRCVSGGAAPAQAGPIDVVGYSCMEEDILHRALPGPLAVGDFLVFENVGAYTNVLRPPFIRPCPPILGWRAQRGAFEILKRRETMTDVFATYDF